MYDTRWIERKEHQLAQQIEQEMADAGEFTDDIPVICSNCKKIVHLDTITETGCHACQGAPANNKTFIIGE